MECDLNTQKFKIALKKKIFKNKNKYGITKHQKQKLLLDIKITNPQNILIFRIY